MTLPNFFILGAPKCGTTSLAAWLRAHPEVYLSPLKEPHYFNTDQTYRKCRSEAEYLRQFAAVEPRHRAVGEASVWYLHSRLAVPNILEAIPQARFIVCLRSPVAMAHSLHGHLLHGGREHEPDFAAAWSAAEERRQGLGLGKLAGEPSHLVYPDACALGTQLERLYTLVPRSRVLTVLLDDLGRDPGAEYRRVLAFLGLRDDGRTDFSAQNRARRRRSGLLSSALKTYLTLREVLHIPPLRTGLVRRLDRATTVTAANPPLSADLWLEVAAQLRPQVERLEVLLERDLSHWLAPPMCAHRAGRTLAAA